MTVSSNTQAILLLTAHFAKSDKAGVKPLTPKEWGCFAEWLKLQSLAPESLLRGKPELQLANWQHKTITVERLNELLNRGSALALSMEKWLRAGLWVMTRSDMDYPKLLKMHLRTDSPAVLFGCGNRALLNSAGLAVVGSRNVKEDDLSYSQQLGALAANGGYSIVSGGARGVDEAAMLGSLDADGTAVGILADSLLQASSSAKYRRHIMKKNLVLISPFNPEAGFNAGNAMQRNKYIYCLAAAAFVVHSGKKGGTWTGAMENIKKTWVPLWVKETDDPEAGNNELIKAGGKRTPASIDDLDLGSMFGISSKQKASNADLFGQPAAAVGEPQISEEYIIEQVVPVENDKVIVKHQIVDSYESALLKLRELCSKEPLTASEIAEKLEIEKTQMNEWLKTAIAENKIKKLAKPVRYLFIQQFQEQLNLT